MEKIPTGLKDCYLLIPKRLGDERGYFESVTKKDLEELGFKTFHQVSNSLSGKGIVRGSHYQKDPYCQAKVVRCHRGAVVDVVVDLRKDSPTFGQSVGYLLTPENGYMLYVPRGFGHAFLSLSDDTLFEYYVDNEYMPRLEGGVLWNDPKIGYDWQQWFDKFGIKDPVLKMADQTRPGIDDMDTEFFCKKKKFLVTGVKGQLGHDIVRELVDRGEENILAVDIDDMDITNRDEVMKVVTDYQPDVIFHCAAWTAVDKAEDKTEHLVANGKNIFKDCRLNTTISELVATGKVRYCSDKDMCYEVNVEGTKNITDASIEVGAKLIYMSTDYVFDGKKDGLYTEEDTPNPQSVYGLTKWLGEEEVRRNPNHFITRISWVFGINGKNFVKTMLNLADNYDNLKVVNDQVGSPTYTVDLAKLLVEMAYSKKYGTYHVNNDGYCSWAEFASKIMEINKKNTIITPVTTAEYYAGKDMSLIATRPFNSKLDKTKLKENFYTLPTWEDATRRYSDELSKVYTIKR